jgi:hypothetical protein
MSLVTNREILDPTRKKGDGDGTVEKEGQSVLNQCLILSLQVTM